MKCKFCNEEKLPEQLVQNGNYKRLAKVCKQCWVLRIKQQSCFKTKTQPVPIRKRFVPGLISYYKSKPCMDCKIEYPPWVMQYDHRPDEVKEFNLCKVGKSAEKITTLQILEEIKKCDVVCANCHMHRTLIRQIGNEAALSYNEYIKEMSFYGKTLEEFELELKKPPTEKTLKYRKDSQSIGNGVSRISARKVERPSKEELEKMVWEIPTWKLAEQLGVSDKAIWKWCKCYGISKPPRGYWAKVQAGK